MDHAEKIVFHMERNSLIARLAAFFIKGKQVAIVFGRTIYLYNASDEELLKHPRWLRHELMHVQQYQQQGTVLFIIKYLWESCCKGYWNNRYEIEARAAEDIIDFEKKFEVVSRKEEQKRTTNH